MVWTKKTGAVYHQQDTDYYCGAATAQMILHSIGAGLLDQDVLYNSNHSHNTQSGWYTDPDGLSYTLNHRKPATFNNGFVVFAKDTERAASKKIVYTLWKYNVAPGTLVYAWGHWIVTRGVSTDVEPTSGTTYAINGFYINNPWPPSPSFYDPADAPPPPHSGACGCGTGGDRGITNEYVPYDTTWKDTYMVGFTLLAGKWFNKFVNVCDPEVPKFGNLTMKQPEFWAKGDNLISSDEAIKFVQKGIELHHLDEDETFVHAIAQAQPAEPVLVQRLDLPDTFYYLIPMVRVGEGITAMFSVDGLHGNFRGGQVFEKPRERVFMDRDKVIESVLKRPMALRDKIEGITLRKEASCFYPIMVWKPCYESRSLYYPFYMITVGNRNIYVGYDGTIYTRLHDVSIFG